MKSFIISQTKIGYRNRTNDQLDYFYNYLIPYIKSNSSSGDILIHLGNTLNNRTNINIKLLNEVYNIFDMISSYVKIYFIEGANDIYSIDLFNKIKNSVIVKDLEIINNMALLGKNSNIINIENNIKYTFFNINYLQTLENYKKIDNCFSGYYESGNNSNDNIYNVFSPYQLNKQNNNNGFYVIDNNNIEFIKNDYSPVFREIIIENIDQLKEIEKYKNDIIDIKIPSNLANKKEVSLFLSNYTINNMDYLDYQEESDVDINFIENNSNIKNILTDYIKKQNPDLIKDLSRIFRIHEKKTTHC